MKHLRSNPVALSILIFLSLLFGSVGLGFFLQVNPITKPLDQGLYVLLSTHFHSRVLDLIIAPFNFNWVDWAGPLPTYLYSIILGTLIYLAFKERGAVKYAALAFLIGSIISYILTYVDFKFVFRERPFVNLPNNVGEVGRQAWEKLSSFPSGHTRETTLFTTIMTNFIPKMKWITVAFVTFIAYSRVYVGAHFPTDALAGIIIGYFAAKSSLLLVKSMYEQNTEKTKSQTNI